MNSAKNNSVKRLAINVLNALYFVQDTLCLLASPKVKQQQGVALVRLDGVGDFIVWLNTCFKYQEIFANQKITLIADASWAKFAEKFSYWDSVIAVDTRKLYFDPVYRWNIVKTTKALGVEVAIESTYSRVFLHGDSMLRATCAKKKIGSVGDFSNTNWIYKKISDCWYTERVSARPGSVMEIDRNEEFFNNMIRECDSVRAMVSATAWNPSGTAPEGKQPTSHGPGSMRLAKQTAQSLIPRLLDLPSHLRVEGDYAVVFPGASWTGKMWPVEKFAEVTDHMTQHHGLQIVICGHISDRVACDGVMAHCKNTALIDFVGQSSLPELVEIIRKARLLLANDTAAVHIAAMVNTPSVCILGGGHFGRFMPYTDTFKGIRPVSVYHEMHCYNCNWRCTQPYSKTDPVPCISGVETADVIGAVDRVMHQAKAQASAA